ncbi:MAG: glutamate-cysteine ligase family protein, partial [bacterium]
PVMEGETLVALTRDEAAITLEPAGQLELSGAPMKTAHETCRELFGHINELRRISDPWDVGWLTLGRNPITATDDLPWMPKERYAIMRSYLPRRGSMALDMMLGTGTVQTNIDYADERDMAAKMRLASAVAPILTALYANSPFAGGQPTGFLSTRSHVWQNTDPDRCGIPPAVFHGDFGYGDYIDFALDVPMFFIQREGRYLDYAGKSFRAFLSDGLDGHRATQADWVLHLSTLFPEARLKNVIELRMVDVGPLPMICSLPALTRGLFYDEGALAEATGLVGALEPNSYPELQRDAARLALAAQAGGKPLREWARELLHIAAAGLGRLNAVDGKGENEVKYLDPLFRIVETGKTNADLLLEHWRGDWKGSVEPLFNEEMML